MGMFQWISDNVILTIVLVLATFVGLTGFILFVDGIYILANFATYTGSFEGAGKTYYLFGVPVILLGFTIVVMACIGCCAAATSVNCLLIYFMASLWYFALLEGLVAGLALSTANMQVTINGVVCHGLYDCLPKELELVFHRDFKVTGRSNQADFNRDADAEVLALELSSSKGCDQEPPAEWEVATTRRLGPTLRAEGPTSLTFDALQRDLECCGLDGPDDYGKFGLALPSTCCRPDLVGGTCRMKRAYRHGCKRLLIRWLRSSVTALGVFAAISCGITIAALLISFVLMVMICSRE